MRFTAAVMEEKSGLFKLDTVELASPQPDEVLVKITATGVCHSDLHARNGYFAMPYPGVYGHEGVGAVTDGRFPTDARDLCWWAALGAALRFRSK